MPVALLQKAGSLRPLKVSCHRDPVVPHHHLMKGVYGGETCTALGTSGKGVETKTDQILGCSGLYMGKEFGSLNIHITTEVLRIKQNQLGLVDERGRHSR